MQDLQSETFGSGSPFVSAGEALLRAQEVELNGKLRLLSGDGAVIFVSLPSEFTQGKRIVRPKPCASISKVVAF